MATKRTTKKKPETSLVLRVCDKDGKSYNDFQWPESGPVEAPDWRDDKQCGHGLHGWLWGEGDGSVAEIGAEDRWLVVEVKTTQIVDLNGKVKFPRGVVVFGGDRIGATRYLAERCPTPKAIIGAVVEAGDRGTATAGDRGTATAGHGGTATAGHGGTIVVKWWDNAASRYRMVVGYVGEEGIEPNVAYRLDGDHKFAKAEEK